MKRSVRCNRRFPVLLGGKSTAQRLAAEREARGHKFLLHSGTRQQAQGKQQSIGDLVLQSASLKSLERRLGARLFERSTRALRLTAEGDAFLNHAKRAVEILEEGQNALLDASTNLKGTIQVTAPSDLTRRLLVPWYHLFLARYPHLSLSLLVSDSVRDVVRDDAEIAHQWALAGHGIVYKSTLDLHQALRTKKLLPLFAGYLGESIPLHAVLPSNRFVPLRVRTFVDFLSQKFRAFEG